MYKINVNIILLITICLMVYSCYSPNSGCLDPNASNYDVSADETCESCCTATTLTLRLESNYDTVSFAFNDTLVNDLEQRFLVKNLQYFIDDIELIGADMKSYRVQDSVTLSFIDQDSFAIVDDLLFVSPNRPSNTVGTFDNFISYDSLYFNFGMSEVYFDASRDELPDDYSLVSDADTMYIDALQRYAQLRILIQTNADDSLSLDTFDILDNELSFKVSSILDTTFIRGENITVIRSVDYKKLFGLIDFTMSREIIREQIINNCPQAFQ